MSRPCLPSLGVVLLGLLVAIPCQAQGVTPPKPKANVAAADGANKAPRKNANPGDPPAKPGQAVRITEEVRPAFIIDPIVNRVEARRGKVVNMEFAITCQGSPAALEIRPVALTQDENGTIFPNEKVPAPTDLEILTPKSVDLKPEGKFVIKARLRVPETQSTFHSFGILVRDSGQLRAKPNDDKPEGPRVGIRFVTQYLLRCDVSVQGVRSDNARKLLVNSAELIEVDGVPQVYVYVENPTEGPIEFGLKAQILASEDGEERPSFPLGMPVRANLDEPEKFFGRILPGARIRMVSLLPKPIFPGQYYLETAMMSDNRVLAKSGFPIVVTEGDFPAQGIASVLAGPGLLASPSQIELSLQRGGSRAQVLTFQNDGSAATEVEIVPESFDGKPVDWAAVRPDKITLAAGASRKVQVTMTAAGDQNNHRYVRLRVKSTPEGGQLAQTTPVTVAMVGKAPGAATLSEGELVWDTEHGTPAFVIDIKNTGNMHMPLEGELLLGNEEGRPIVVRGGFGKWILPNATERVRFNPPKSMAPGKYTARLRINAGDGEKPIEKRLELNLGGNAGEQNPAEPTKAAAAPTTQQ